MLRKSTQGTTAWLRRTVAVIAMLSGIAAVGFVGTAFSGRVRNGGKPPRKPHIAHRAFSQSSGDPRIVGVNYGPFRDGQSPDTGVYPTTAQMQEDMPILAKMAGYIRTYSVTHGLEQISGLANPSGLKTVPTAWLGKDTAANDAEIANLITVANQNSNVSFVAVGSEALLRGDVTKSQLIGYINQVKQSVSVPVTTAEPWHIYRDNPDLAAAVDLIFINIHPYWEGQSVSNAVAYVLQRYNEIKAQYPGKRVVISETGWPTAGNTIGSAVPSVANQKLFIQDLMVKALEQNVEYFLFEAFDENWKRNSGEGEVGAHWGFYNANRTQKHNFGTLQIEDLSMGVGVPGTISTSVEARFYRASVSGSEPLFAHLDKPKGWDGGLAVFKGTLNSTAMKQSDAWEDQMVMVDAPEAGTYYIQVWSSEGGYPYHRGLPGDYTLTARRSLDGLTTGQGQTGRVPASNDKFWYQVSVSGSEPLFAHLDKPKGWDGGLAVYKGTLNSTAVKQSEAWEDQMLMVDSPEAGTYYIQVWSSGFYNNWHRGLPGDYTLTASRSLQALTFGQALPDQQLSWDGDAKWYQVPVQAGQKVFAELHKGSGFSSFLSMTEGALPGGGNSTSYDQVVEVTASGSGYCYVRVESNASGGGTFSITGQSEQTFPTLTAGQGQAGKMSLSNGVYWYQVQVTGSQPLFVHLDKPAGWDGGVSVYKGSLNSTPVKQSEAWEDQMLMVDSPEAGTYYIQVWSSGFYNNWHRGLPGDYTLTASRSLQALTFGQALPDQQLSWDGDAKWYQVPVQAGQKVFAELHKGSGFSSFLSMTEGALPGGGNSTTYDQVVEVTASGSGYCYVRVESNASGGGTFSITGQSQQTFPTLTAGQGQTGKMSLSNGVKWYQVQVTGSEPLFAHLDKPAGWDAGLAVFKGTLNSTAVKQSEAWEDQMVMVDAPETGTYYIQVWSSGFYYNWHRGLPGDYTLTARRSLEALTFGQALDNQQLSWDGDVRWYQVQLNSPSPLVINVTKTGSWSATLRVKRGSLPIAQPFWWDSGSGNLEVAVLAGEPGTYYVQAESDSSGGTYSIVASASVSQATKSLIVDNDILTAQISIARGCVTSLKYKKGSNTELIAPNWGSYLIDLGTDPQRGQTLAKDWRVQNATVQASSCTLAFSHPSGFSNGMSLTWGQGGIDLSCDLSCPAGVELFSVLRPGGGWESGRDKWAFPETDGVRQGSFTYPGPHTALYPADHSWGNPRDGWIALWDDAVDEVYGFTLSSGIQAKICNGAGADQHFKTSAGNSRIAFHVVKPKPAQPYDAIRSLVSGAFLKLEKKVDKGIAAAGEELAYTLTFQNTGDADATGAVLQDDLPESLEPVSGSISNGGTYDAGARRITWNIGTVAKGSPSRSVTFKATVKSGGAQGSRIVNTARIYHSADPVPTTAIAETINATPTDLILGADQTLSLTNGVKTWCRFTVPASPSPANDLFFTLQTHCSSWSNAVSVSHAGTVLNTGSGSEVLLNVSDPEPGEYVVEITPSGTGSAQVRAGTTLTVVTAGTLFVGTVYRRDGLDWSQIEVPEGTGLLRLNVEAPGSSTDLDVCQNCIDCEPHWRKTGTSPLQLEIPDPTAGTYYMRVSDHGRLTQDCPRDYSILATLGEGATVVDNTTIRAVVSADTASVTHLTFKSGSNKELVNGNLMHLGADPVVGKQLSTGWQRERSDIGAATADFEFSHTGGFRKQLFLSWNDSHVEVRTEITSPNNLTLDNNINPAGYTWGSDDQWAVPMADGVQVGNSAYPSNDTVAPSETWMGFWDGTADEVYGFTFSRGYKVQAARNSTTPARFWVPAGQSTLTFHVVKSKPAQPYDAIRNLTTAPYLTLTKTVDRLFAGKDSTLTYTLTFGNTGASQATAVTVVDTLPPEVTCVTNSASDSGVYDSSLRTMTWNLGDLAAGSTGRTVTFQARVNSDVADGTVITNTAHISCAEERYPVPAEVTTKVASPKITSISPTSGGNTGSVTITINGENLDPKATVKLTATNLSDIVAKSVSGRDDGTQLNAQFDLTGQPAGSRQVVVTNPNGAGSIAEPENADDFTVESGGAPKLWVDVLGREQLRVGRTSTCTIEYGNTGTLDAYDVVLTVKVPNNVTCSVDYPPPPFPLQYQGQIPSGVVVDSELVTDIWILKLPSGASDSFTVTITVPGTPSGSSIEIKGEIKQAPSSNFTRTGDLDDLETSPTFNALADAIWETWPTASAANARSSSSERPSREGVGAGIHGFWETWNLLPMNPYQKPYATIIGATVGYVCGGVYGMAGGLIIGGAIDLAAYTFNFATQYFKWSGAMLSNSTSIFVNSSDPNAKAGPSGFDPQNTPSESRKRHASTARGWPYTIYFENKPEATAAAQEVFITDQLDSNLDWSTLAFGSIQIGSKTLNLPPDSKSITKDWDLRPETNAILKVKATFDGSTGLVKWELKGTDPFTGELADFLPRDTTPPMGEGWVSYTVQPKQTVPTGTVIKNKATIVFDVNPPMDTPEVFNTVDSGAPTSKVALGAGSQATSFVLTWPGADDEEGSGVRDYTVHVADKPGKDQPWGGYQPWRTNTTETSGTFAGQVGHSYRFYCIARDNVGNEEPKPEEADLELTCSAETTLSKGWQLFSVPVTPFGENADAELSDDINPLILWGWSGLAYSWKPRLSPGLGCWLYVPTDSAQVEVGGGAVVDNPFRISLLKGWNLVGQAHNFSVYWKDCSIQPLDAAGQPTGRSVPMTAANIGDYVSPVLYGWRDKGYRPLLPDSTATLDAWGGYWVLARKVCQLLIPARAATRAEGAQPSAARRVPSAENWRLSLVLSDGESSDNALLGVAPDASKGFDGFSKDLPKPPFSPNGVQTYFAHPEWNAKDGSIETFYLQDLRSRLTAQEVWEFEALAGDSSAFLSQSSERVSPWAAFLPSARHDPAATPREHRTVTVIWPDMTQVPKEYRLTLEDCVTNTRRYMRTTSSYSFTPGPGEARRLRVIVEPTRGKLLRITNVLAQTLSDRAVAIHYVVTQDAEVAIVLRAPNGRVMASLPPQPIRAGLNRAMWDGVSRSGRLLSRGVYLIELTARTEEGQQVRAVRTLRMR